MEESAASVVDFGSSLVSLESSGAIISLSLSATVPDDYQYQQPTAAAGLQPASDLILDIPHLWALTSVLPTVLLPTEAKNSYT